MIYSWLLVGGRGWESWCGAGQKETLRFLARDVDDYPHFVFNDRHKANLRRRFHVTRWDGNFRLYQLVSPVLYNQKHAVSYAINIVQQQK